jgi:hypothetical protein
MISEKRPQKKTVSASVTKNADCLKVETLVIRGNSNEVIEVTKDQYSNIISQLPFIFINHSGLLDECGDKQLDRVEGECLSHPE